MFVTELTCSMSLAVGQAIEHVKTETFSLMLLSLTLNPYIVHHLVYHLFLFHIWLLFHLFRKLTLSLCCVILTT